MFAQLGIDDSLAIAAFALAIIGGIANVVWLLASIKAELRNLTSKVDNYAEKTGELETHAHDCDKERTQITVTIDDHQRRLSNLEAL